MKAIEFIEKLPERVDSASIEGENEIFHFDLTGEGGGQSTVKVQDGSVTVIEGLQGDPSCVIEASASDFEKLVKGELNAMMAVFTGKLKISNQSLMMKYAKKFGMT